MTNKELQKIIKIYSERLSRYGNSPVTLGWNNDRRKLRYKILSSEWNLNNVSILDFGCGFGDFYEFLKKKFRNIQYTGIDINPNFIEICQKQYPQARFSKLNIFNDKLQEKYDYILASGVFNDKIDDNYSFVKDAFRKFNDYSIKGFAANFLSNKVQYRHNHAYYSDPALILDLCYQYSNNVILKNDYMPFEFTVFVNKKSKFDKKLAVYSEYLKDL